MTMPFQQSADLRPCQLPQDASRGRAQICSIPDASVDIGYLNKGSVKGIHFVERVAKIKGHSGKVPQALTGIIVFNGDHISPHPLGRIVFDRCRLELKFMELAVHKAEPIVCLMEIYALA